MGTQPLIGKALDKTCDTFAPIGKAGVKLLLLFIACAYFVAWFNKPLAQADADTSVKYIVIHHTALTQPLQLDLVDKGHERRGYEESSLGYNACYHLFIGKDGTVVQTRPLTDRQFCTQNEYINQHAIQIVLAGNFNEEEPGREQIRSFFREVELLKAKFPTAEVIPHSSASPDACPGRNMIPYLAKLGYQDQRYFEKFSISRYYTPVPGQSHYYRDTYEQDFAVNCQGDCFVTADGTNIREMEPFSVLACPPEIPFGTRFWIEGIGVATCHDRGGAIKQRRLDLWAGYGGEAVDRIRDPKNPSGELLVMRLP